MIARLILPALFALACIFESVVGLLQVAGRPAV